MRFAPSRGSCASASELRKRPLSPTLPVSSVRPEPASIIRTASLIPPWTSRMPAGSMARCGFVTSQAPSNPFRSWTPSTASIARLPTASGPRWCARWCCAASNARRALAPILASARKSARRNRRSPAGSTFGWKPPTSFSTGWRFANSPRSFGDCSRIPAKKARRLSAGRCRVSGSWRSPRGAGAKLVTGGRGGFRPHFPIQLSRRFP